MDEDRMTAVITAALALWRNGEPLEDRTLAEIGALLARCTSSRAERGDRAAIRDALFRAGHDFNEARDIADAVGAVR